MGRIRSCTQVFITFLGNSSIHGYHYLVDAKLHLTERFFWLVAILCSSYTGIYLMLRGVQENTLAPISLTVDTLYLDWTHSFPAVVFCENSREPTEAELKMFGIPAVDFRTISVMKDLLFWKGTLSSAFKCNETDYAAKHCFMKANFSENAQKIRKSCETILGTCAWMGEEFECCDWFKPMYTIEGICFAINSMVSTPPTTDKLKFTYKDSPMLRIEMKYTDVSLNILTAEDTLSFRETSYGNVFDLSNKNIKPNEEHDVYIQFQNIVNDDRVEKVPIDIRGCRFPHENNLRFSKVYSYPACILDHLTQKMLANCSCHLYHMPIADIEETKCKTLESMICINNIFTKIVEDASQESCNISCVETDINVVAKLEKYHVDEKEDVLAVINLITFPPTLRYHRKVVRDSVDLTVNVGGIGTLFFGCSILSLVEIIYYLFIRPCGDYNVDKKGVEKRRQKAREFMQRQFIKAIEGTQRPYERFGTLPTAYKKPFAFVK